MLTTISFRQDTIGKTTRSSVRSGTIFNPLKPKGITLHVRAKGNVRLKMVLNCGENKPRNSVRTGIHAKWNTKLGCPSYHRCTYGRTRPAHFISFPYKNKKKQSRTHGGLAPPINIAKMRAKPCNVSIGS